MANTAAITQGFKRFVDSTTAAVKSVYETSPSLKATLNPITSINVPVAFHTVSVIKGRAYLFGGKTISKTGGQELADNDVHVVVLPQSSIETADYKRIPASSNAPSRRFGHSAAVIEDRIYIFGGRDTDDGKPLDDGRIYVFDTRVEKWYHLDPPVDGKRPEARAFHASVASEHPQAIVSRTDEGYLPQQPPDPAKVVPEPQAPDTYGTLIVHGGRSSHASPLHDIWTFDLQSRTWAELPDPPAPSSPIPSLAIQDKRLYIFSQGLVSFLDLTGSAFNDKGGKGELGLSPLGPWLSLPLPASSPDKAHPGDRVGAALEVITTGQGRFHLLLVGGQSLSGEPLGDVWTLQLKPEGMTAASLNDAARLAMKYDVYEHGWEEVRYHDADGAAIQPGQVGCGIGARSGFAAARTAEIDGGSILAWGGVASDKVKGDGVIVSVE